MALTPAKHTKNKPVTDTQREVLQLAATYPDYTEKEIAEAMGDPHIKESYVRAVTNNFELPADELEELQAEMGRTTEPDQEDTMTPEAKTQDEKTEEQTDDQTEQEQAQAQKPEAKRVPTEEEIDEEMRGVRYECTYCGYRGDAVGDVRKHITARDDATHRDRKGSDPGAVNVVNGELLMKVNERVKLPDNEQRKREVIEEEDFRIIYAIWLNPHETQKAIAKRLDMRQTRLSKRMRYLGYNWPDRHDLVDQVFNFSPPAELPDEPEDEEPADEDEADEEPELSDEAKDDIEESRKQVEAGQTTPLDEVEAEADADDSKQAERIKRRFGNRAYEGPETGIDLTTGKHTSTLAQAQARRRAQLAREGKLLNRDEGEMKTEMGDCDNDADPAGVLEERKAKAEEEAVEALDDARREGVEEATSAGTLTAELSEEAAFRLLARTAETEAEEEAQRELFRALTGR